MKLPENERLIVVSRLLEAMPAEDSTWSLDDASLVEVKTAALPIVKEARRGLSCGMRSDAGRPCRLSSAGRPRIPAQPGIGIGERSAEVAERFVSAVDRAVSRIVKDVESLPTLTGVYRYVRVVRFPYVLAVRRVHSGLVQIVAVAHTSRRPTTPWRRRA